MRSETRTLLAYWALVAILAIAAGWFAAEFARSRARTAFAAGVANDARLRAALFDSEVARYRLVPLALGDDRDVVATLSGAVDARSALDRKLEDMARSTGATVIYVMDRRGIALASSNWRTRQSFVGRDYRFRRYVRDALRTGSAAQFARGTVSGEPGLYLSRRTADGGVIVIKLQFDAIERAWAGTGGDTFVTDADGVVLVSSRPAYRFTLSRPLTQARLAAVRAEASLPPDTLRPLPAAGNAVAATVATGQPGWTLTLRRTPTGIAAAGRIAGVAAAIAVVVAAAIAWSAWRRASRTRLRTAELENAVAARTADLRREMDERAAGEARAAELREGLRQANRLATLGQVTASVAHETAQPVAAIRTYAQTSAMLLVQGDEEAVRDNLDAIAKLADRIGTVTAELRGFAKRRPGDLRPLPLAEVVEGAYLILREQLRTVTLDRPDIPADLAVRGGRVRLEQVLVNLLQNALEAVRGRPDPRIRIDLDVRESQVILSVCDNGPGVPADLAARLFTPFVTNRAEGLGLGLVIAHDIMLDLGGTLRHVPGTPGARFDMEMQRV